MGAANLQQIHNLLNDLNDLCGMSKVHMQIDEGVWPNVKVYVVDLRSGNKTKDTIDLFFVIQTVLTATAVVALKSEDTAERFYKILSRHLSKLDAPFTPIATEIYSEKLDLHIYGTVPVPHQTIEFGHFSDWHEYCIKNFADRIAPAHNIPGVELSEVDSVALFVSLLTTMLLAPEMVQMRNETTLKIVD